MSNGDVQENVIEQLANVDIVFESISSETHSSAERESSTTLNTQSYVSNIFFVHIIIDLH